MADLLASLLSDDEEYDNDGQDDEKLPTIAALSVQDDMRMVTLSLDDSLFEDENYTQSMRTLFQWLKKNEKALQSTEEQNKYKLFSVYVDLIEKEAEIHDNEPLFCLKYVLQYTKTYITSLDIDITAFRLRAARFHQMPDALDNAVLLNIFHTMHECVSKHRLRYLDLEWIPVHISNYQPITNGLIDILSIKQRAIDQPLSMSVLFTSEWLKSLCTADDTLSSSLLRSIETCSICSRLEVVFDKSAHWFSFNQASMRFMSSVFTAISSNAYIHQLCINMRSCDIDSDTVQAISECLKTKNIKHTKNETSGQFADFRLSLQLNDSFEDEHLHQILNALYENEDICLRDLQISRVAKDWDAQTMRCICELLEDGQHQLDLLLINGRFVTDYYFGTYKVIGLDLLVDTITNKDIDEDESMLQLQAIAIGKIMDDNDCDVYHDYVIKLIEECNIWLSSITLQYQKFSSAITEIIESMFSRLQTVYECMQCIKEQLRQRIDDDDVVEEILDFCKMNGFEISIVDDADDAKRLDLSADRVDFRDSLHRFFESIQFEFTPTNSEKNRLEFQTFVNSISKSPIGIWRGCDKTVETCVSVIV